MASPKGQRASFLALIANHERELLERVKDAETQAAERIKETREQCARIAGEAEARRNECVDRVKQECAEEREKARTCALESARAELEGVREELRKRVPQAVEEIIRLIVPPAGEQS